MTDTQKATGRPMTATPWHVVKVRGGRIIGDETAEGPGLLRIQGPNATVAHVYKTRDARHIVTAVNAFDAMREALGAARATLDVAMYGLDLDGPRSAAAALRVHGESTLAKITAALAAAEGKGE